MNKLHFLAIMVIAVFLAYGCNTKNSSEQAENATEKTIKEIANIEFNTDQLMQSALNGEHKNVEAALNNGFDVNTIDANKRTLLMLASFNGHTELVELLIAKGSNVNLRDGVSRSALMYASTGPFAPTVNILLKAGAEPNMTDDGQNWTPAMMAAAEGQLEVLKVLVKNGADLEMVDVDGESPLYFAKSNGHSEVVKYIQSQLK